jgi:Icc-related predicted phosphoesterase
MKMLFVADLHYTLKQFDWVMANATKYDPIIIGGDLLDLSSSLDPDIQIAVIEKYLYRLLQQTRVVVCSGNHDLDSRNAVYHAPPAGSAVCWNGRKFVGDEFLRESILRFSPDLVLSGHIHDAPFYKGGSWVDRIAQTWVFNVGRQPGPWPTYIVLDPDSMTAEWTSFEKQSVQRLTMADC